MIVAQAVGPYAWGLICSARPTLALAIFHCGKTWVALYIQERIMN